MASRYKVAFFDIDGTLVSFKTHAMPASTVRAILAMKAKGVVPVVCTGRQVSTIPPEVASLMEDVVAISGQLCIVGGEVVRSCSIDSKDVRTVVGQAEAGLYDLAIMLRDTTFVNRVSERTEALARQVDLRYPLGDVRLAFENPVYQMCAFLAPGEEEVVLAATRSVIATRWTDLFCDLMPADGGKDYGVRAVLEYLGLAPEEAIAFGDGENDLAMFEAVGTGVAMGNAYGVLKARASYVTDDVDDDGLWNACVHFGLV